MITVGRLLSTNYRLVRTSSDLLSTNGCSIWSSGFGAENRRWLQSKDIFQAVQKRHLWISQSCDYDYDVIVVGGGHAGTEAAAAAARMGSQTLLITHKLSTIGEMSCNPAFGGIGKGHLMKEIDALDGLCARICDTSGIQYKMLNKCKGPAVWGPRAQIDRSLYKRQMQEEIHSTPNLTVRAAPVEDLIVGQSPPQARASRQCRGVVLDDGTLIYGRTVILTTGTFLRGMIFLGEEERPAGRMGDGPAIGLAKTLEEAEFNLGRLKTGTPPRLDKRTIDFSRTEAHNGDDPPVPFSFLNDRVWLRAEEQVPCYLTHTTPDIEPIIRDTLDKNKHAILEETSAPRYCPSIESKVLRFKKSVHQVWLEPEGFESDVVYPNGISCTMDVGNQQKLVNAITGLENAVIVQPGYGVHYDFVDPRELRRTLETRRIGNLFLAGQINGTTGYEEAAAQGLLAGVNAACIVQDRPEFIVDRTEAYLGVLVDDLTTRGTNEPYRMFTSRAEFRLSLRPDNADRRLTKRGYETGCVKRRRMDVFTEFYARLDNAVSIVKDMNLSVSKWRSRIGLKASKNNSKITAFSFLSSPEVSVDALIRAFPEEFGFLREDPKIAERLKTEAMYEHHVESQLREMAEIRREEQMCIPDDLDYDSTNLSRESKEILRLARPPTLAAASRLQGITPACLVHLLYHVRQSQKSYGRIGTL